MKHHRDGPDDLRAMASEIGLTLRQEQAELMLAHLESVLDANRRTNLTRITSWHEGIRLHVLDSIACAQEFAAAPEGLAVDLGSGAGFPGIPLAIASGRPIVLVESVGKKADYLSQVVDELSLGGLIKVHRGRAESLAIVRPGHFSSVTARAVSSLASLLELASPLLAEDGVLVALKGAPDEAELEAGLRAAAIVGMEPTGNRRLALPGGGETRTICCYVKVGPPKIPLPRADGRAQKRPLG